MLSRICETLSTPLQGITLSAGGVGAVIGMRSVKLNSLNALTLSLMQNRFTTVR